MPRGDGTGPMGMGPMTGRAAGYCAGYPVPGHMNPMPGGRGMAWGRGSGRGMGMAWGRGRGAWGRGWGAGYGGWGMPPAPYGVPHGAPPTVQQEIDLLRGQSESLEEALKSIRHRIEDLEADKAKQE